MKALKNFIDYSELSTKLASVIPFMVTVAYVLYAGYRLNIGLTALFFVAMLLFDMAVTMINNHIDRKQAGKEGYFSHPVELTFIASFVVLATFAGLYLTLSAGLVFLLVGMLCFGIGIGYTYGPFPISRSPFSEVFSGLTEGFLLPLLIVLLNTSSLFIVALHNGFVTVVINVEELGPLILVCIPLMACIANIMIANNICDYEADLETRYTMVRHIGIKNSLHCFSGLYVLSYIAIIMGAIVNVLPLSCLLVVLTAPWVIKNIKKFYQKQVKSETFIVSIQNFLLLLVPYWLTICIGVVIALWM